MQLDRYIFIIIIIISRVDISKKARFGALKVLSQAMTFK